MIIRTWTGRAVPANATAYIEHFESNVVPELRAVAGFRGALLLREDRDAEVEFLVVTKWASFDALRTFAGDDITRAVVEPEAIAVLASFEVTARHYDLVDEITVPT